MRAGSCPTPRTWAWHRDEAAAVSLDGPTDRAIVSPENGDVQNRVREDDVQVRLRGRLGLVVSGVPLTANKVHLPDDQEAAAVEPEGLDVISRRAALGQLGLAGGSSCLSLLSVAA